MKRHHQLFQRRISRPLTNAVDRAFELTRTVFHRLEEVGDRQPQVVVSMHGQHRIGDVRHMLINASDQRTEFARGGVTDGVRDVDGAGTGCNGSLNHLVQKLGITAAGVLTGELDVIHQGAGVGHHVRDDGEHLLPALTQLVLQMNIAGGDEGVNPPAGRRRDSIRAGLDVATGCPGQSADHRSVLAAHLLGDALHSSKIAGTGKGETCLDHIHTEPGQLLGDRQLLLEIEAGARRLLTIPEGGVEDQNAAWIVGHGKRLDAI